MCAKRLGLRQPSGAVYASQACTMKEKIVIIVLSLILAVVSYFLGYSNNTLRDFEMREAQGRLGLNLSIYNDMERGDFQKVKEHLGMVILGQTRIYEQQYGVPVGTNFFAQKFLAAQAIASQIESNLVPVNSILTNFPHSSGLKVTAGGNNRSKIT
jgi:hypothetical protein